MKNKKILFLLIIVLIIILLSLFIIIKNFVTINEEQDLYSDYTPQEEISSNQMRETIVTLYFIDINNELKSEGRFIDSISLLQNPYKELVSLLLSGPRSDDLKLCFPENTQILDAKCQNGQVILNFSSEILNYIDDAQKLNIINSLLNTLTQLNEVDSFKILINNQPNDNFSDVYTLIN